MLALLVNSFALIPVYGNLNIHLGQVFVVICLVSRGVFPALLTVLLSSLGLYLSIQSYPLIFLTLLEAIALMLFFRKGVLLIIVDILYWLLVGIPAVLLIIQLFFSITSADFTQVILIKQAMNGVLSVSLALLVMPFVPTRWYSQQVGRKLHTLSNRIFELSLICIVLPSLVITLILSDNSASRFETELSEELSIRAEHLQERVENYTADHLKAIESLAIVISDATVDRKQAILENWNQRYPGFLTMIVVDKAGVVETGVPKEQFLKVLSAPKTERNIKDRDYFYVPQKTGQPFISDAFKGRGFGNDPIVALSAPIFVDGEFSGLVEGSLNLPNFEMLDKSGDDSSILVLDSNGRVIYASSELALKSLTTASLVEKEQLYTDNLPALELNAKSFNYKTTKASNGWKIYVLSPFDGLILEYRNDFYGLIIGIFVIALIVLAVSRRFSIQVTRPLERLVRYFSSYRPVPDKARSYFSSQEIESVREQLQSSQRLMMDFQEELKQQVEEKTKALIKANEQLELLSTHDSMTGVMNRRGFEAAISKVYSLACRNQTPMTLAILDLDHFKVVNDTYGHSAGDECLVGVAQEMTKVFQRDSDFVARFGGEEFIILIIGTNTSDHVNLLESLRKNIESLQIDSEGQKISVTVSIGAYCQKERFNKDYEQVVSWADKLLYQSKENGRNRLTYHEG